jgi:hypothetical protein
MGLWNPTFRKGRETWGTRPQFMGLLYGMPEGMPLYESLAFPIPGGMGLWNPTFRKGRETWGTRL